MFLQVINLADRANATIPFPHDKTLTQNPVNSAAQPSQVTYPVSHIRDTIPMHNFAPSSMQGQYIASLSAHCASTPTPILYSRYRAHVQGAKAGPIISARPLI